MSLARKVCVTGGGGFIGAHLVKRLVEMGWQVSVVDSMLRGDLSRLSAVVNQIEIHNLDVRDKESLVPVFKGAELVIHLAAVNGTENFYKHPELVFDVGVLGAIAVAGAAREAKVHNIIYASSAEVYQTSDLVPTPENVPLMLPDSLNPRYSYGGSKIATELVAFNYGANHFNKVQVFRPHNIYGPDMGWKHVVPQFIARMFSNKNFGKQIIDFEIQGNGTETRAFCYVDDLVTGILKMYELGDTRQIYHIGNDHEISINDLCHAVAKALGGEVRIVSTEAPSGATARRCPDITKMKAIGYAPTVDLNEGIGLTVGWYAQNFKKSMNALL